MRGFRGMNAKMTAFDYFMTLVVGVGVEHAVRLTGRKFRLNGQPVTSATPAPRARNYF